MIEDIEYDDELMFDLLSNSDIYEEFHMKCDFQNGNA